MENIVLILLLAGIIGGAVAALVRATKRGNPCIGCPHSGTCGHCDKKQP